jgi:hypothetical protein
MSGVGRWTTAFVLVVACNDKTQETPFAPFGYLDDTKVEQLRATCPTAAELSIVGDDRPDEASFVYLCDWQEGSDLAWNSVTISARKKDRRIDRISLATKDRAVATRTFERFAGLVLSAVARDELRRTLEHEDSQLRLEAKDGRFVKHDDGRGAISWSYVPYVPGRP